jgi:hypothetical protein
MFAVIVPDDIGMPEGGQNLELGMELFALFLGHLEVADFLPAENHAVGLAADFADDAKGAMAWEDGQHLVSRRAIDDSDTMVLGDNCIPIFSSTSYLSLSDMVMVMLKQD